MGDHEVHQFLKKRFFLVDRVKFGSLSFAQVQHFCRDDFKAGIFKTPVYRAGQVFGYCIGFDNR